MYEVILTPSNVLISGFRWEKIRHFLAQFNSADGPLFIGKYSLDEILKPYIFLCLFKLQGNNSKI